MAPWLLGTAALVFAIVAIGTSDPSGSARPDAPPPTHSEASRAEPTLPARASRAGPNRDAVAEPTRSASRDPFPPSDAKDDPPDAARRRLRSLLRERLRLERSLAEAIHDFEGGRLESARDGVAAVLREQPDNRKASEVSDAVAAAHTGELSGEALREKRREFVTWLDDLQRPARIEELLMKWPSVDFWGRAQTARARPVSGGASIVEADADLRRTPVSFDLEDVSLTAAVRVLQSEAAVDVTLDPGVRDHVPAYVVRHVSAREMPLSSALDALVAGQDLTWSWAAGGAVITGVGTPRAAPLLKRAFYAVSDLVAAGDGAAVARTSGFASVEALGDAIRAEVDPESWRSVAGAAITHSGAVLVVVATEEVQGHVRNWFTEKRVAK